MLPAFYGIETNQRAPCRKSSWNFTVLHFLMSPIPDQVSCRSSVWIQEFKIRNDIYLQSAGGKIRAHYSRNTHIHKYKCMHTQYICTYIWASSKMSKSLGYTGYTYEVRSMKVPIPTVERWDGHFNTTLKSKPLTSSASFRITWRVSCLLIHSHVSRGSMQFATKKYLFFSTKRKIIVSYALQLFQFPLQNKQLWNFRKTIKFQLRNPQDSGLIFSFPANLPVPKAEKQ